jgi:competence protein ComEA
MNHKATRTLVQGLIVSLMPVASAWAGPVNVNTADATTIARELDGIGPAKAQAIVEYRQKNGPFKTPEDLLKVEGIGDKVLDQNKGNIRVDRGGAAPATASAKGATKPAQKQGGGGLSALPGPGPSRPGASWHAFPFVEAARCDPVSCPSGPG